jgi:C1A family cysteine protease
MEVLADFYEKLEKNAVPEIMTMHYKACLKFADYAKVSQKNLDVVVPVEYDPRLKLLNRIYDQKSCGNCWAISSISAINDHFYLKFKKNITFSIDQAMKCFQSKPCEGGNPAKFLKYLEDTPLYDESCKTCSIDSCKCSNFGNLNTLKIKKNSVVLYRDVDSIKQHLFTEGPMIAGMMIYENFKTGKFGSHGIYLDNVLSYNENGTPVFGTPTHFMGLHSVVVLGFGKADHIETSPGKFETVSFWICRNSWGEDWGDKGFFKIAFSDINKLVYLEKEFLFKNQSLGGALAFDLENPNITKFTNHHCLKVEAIKIGFVIVLLISIFFFSYFIKKKFFKHVLRV